MYINNNNDSSKWILVANKRNLDIWIVHMNLIIVLHFSHKDTYSYQNISISTIFIQLVIAVKQNLL